MKKHFSLLAFSMLLIFGCSNETLEDNNDQLIANKFLKVISNPSIQKAMASSTLLGKSTQAKISNIEPDASYVIVTDFGLVFVQFDTDKVFAFLGVNATERIKEKNGEVQFDTKAKKVYCVVANTISREALYSNLCPDASPNNTSGSLIANGRLMPDDEIILNEEVSGVQKIYKINGAGIINARKIEVDNTIIEISTGGSNLDDYFTCGSDGAIDKLVSVKSETDVDGNIIELITSLD